MQEFHDIVADAEKKIANDIKYASSKEFNEQKQRMTQIMKTVEGCGCDGRAGQLSAMFRNLTKGNTNVLRAFAPLVFKSFHADFKKLFKIM